MRKICFSLSLIVSLASSSVLAASYPLEWNVRAKADQYECKHIEVPVDLCIDKQFSESAAEVIRRSLVRLHTQLFLWPQVPQCIERANANRLESTLSIKSLQAVFKIHQIKNLKLEMGGNGSVVSPELRPEIFVSAFEGKNYPDFESAFVFAYPNFYDNSNPLGLSYISLAINQDFIESRQALFGSSHDFWAAQLLLGILINIDVLEDFDFPEKSDASFAAYCTMFDGHIPPAHEITRQGESR